jgi:hypothetical protein
MKSENKYHYIDRNLMTTKCGNKVAKIIEEKFKNNYNSNIQNRTFIPKNIIDFITKTNEDYQKINDLTIISLLDIILNNNIIDKLEEKFSMKLDKSLKKNKDKFIDENSMISKCGEQILNIIEERINYET